MPLNRRHVLTLIPAAMAVAVAPLHAANFTLANMERSVAADYDIPHLSPAQLVDLARQTSDQVVLFDVRENAEFQVSHVPGASQIDPGISRRKFRKTFAQRLKGKHVVFYCSVGVRSSKLAQKVESDLRRAGALGVYNLSGGIFRLHNETAIPLQTQTGQQTDHVHPYNTHWGQLLTRGKEYHRYTIK